MSTNPNRWPQLILIVIGVFQLGLSLTMLFAPQWFYENVGHFPPFNRHFIGDLGAFTLPLGVGLLLAARAPRQQRLLIGVVALANVLHMGNHLYDDVLGDAWSLTHFLSETGPLMLMTLALVWVWWRVGH